MNEKETAQLIMSESVNVAGSVTKTFRFRIPLRGCKLMTCQHPLSDGPKARRCLHLTLGPRYRYCADHRP